jgi:hypothetical protein
VKRASPSTPFDLAALGFAFLLPLVFSDGIAHPWWMPKAVLALVAVGPAFVVLARMAVHGDGAARMALCFLAVAAFSTMLAERPLLALVGQSNWGTGFLFLVLLAGMWAVGTRLSQWGRSALPVALVASASLSASSAWLRTLDLPGMVFSYQGGAFGLMGNSVYFGALCAAAIWLAAFAFVAKRKSVLWLLPMFVLAGGAQLSLERSALGLTLLAMIAVAWRNSIRRAIVASVVVAAAFIVAGNIAPTATGRSLRYSTSQVGSRQELWRVALAESIRQPILGSGPAHFDAAVEPRSTLAMSKGDLYYVDAHNFLIHLAVTTGWLGLALFLGWLITASVGVSLELGAFALAIGLFSLVEPLWLGLTPLAFMALGAARSPRADTRFSMRWRVPAVALGAIGVGVGAVCLIGDRDLQLALDGSSAGRAKASAELLVPWPDGYLLGAELENHRALHGAPKSAHAAVLLMRRVTDRDPATPSNWVILSSMLLREGDRPGARIALDHAVALSPWLSTSLQLRATMAKEDGDPETLTTVCRRLALLKGGFDACQGVSMTP